MSDELITVEEEPTVTVYIDDNGNIEEEREFLQKIVEAVEESGFKGSDDHTRIKDSVEKVRKALRTKNFEGSNQDISELNDAWSFQSEDLVEPPYPPECFANFLEVDETLSSCVQTKVSDSVGRPYSIISFKPVRVFDNQEDTKEIIDEFVTKEIFNAEKKRIERFIKTCNRIHGFRGVLKKACMDYEAIGWAGIEVIRAADKTIARLEHIPATRLRVMKGWKGFAEIREDGKQTLYQLFGDKVGVTETNPITEQKTFRPYDPELDGPPDPGKLEWNLRGLLHTYAKVIASPLEFLQTVC